MNAASLLAALTLRGISVRADGDQIRVIPASRLTPGELASLKAEKPTLLRLLRIIGSATATDALGSAVATVAEVEEAGAALYLRPEHGLSLWHGERCDDALLIRLVQHHDRIDYLTRWRYSSGLDDLTLVGENLAETTANLIAEAERCGATFALDEAQGVTVDSPPVWSVNPHAECLEGILRALDRTWPMVERVVRNRATEPKRAVASDQEDGLLAAVDKTLTGGLGGYGRKEYERDLRSGKIALPGVSEPGAGLYDGIALCFDRPTFNAGRCAWPEGTSKTDDLDPSLYPPCRVRFNEESRTALFHAFCVHAAVVHRGIPYGIGG